MDVVITINMKKIQFFAPVSTSASDTCAGGLEIEKKCHAIYPFCYAILQARQPVTFFHIFHTLNLHFGAGKNKF